MRKYINIAIYNRYNLLYNEIGSMNSDTISERGSTMRELSTKDLTKMGLLTALVTISTFAIRIPVPATSGYIHLGDSMIFLAAILFGWRYGLIAGGLGSALADILAGYAHWALPTLIIKGLMGLLVGIIAEQKKDKLLNIRNIIALKVGAIIMVVGYYLAGSFMKGSFLVALESVPFNLIQGFGGAILFTPLAIALKKTKIFK